VSYSSKALEKRVKAGTHRWCSTCKGWGTVWTDGREVERTTCPDCKGQCIFAISASTGEEGQDGSD